MNLLDRSGSMLSCIKINKVLYMFSNHSLVKFSSVHVRCLYFRISHIYLRWYYYKIIIIIIKIMYNFRCIHSFKNNIIISF